jgi:nicotinamidase-related amidase
VTARTIELEDHSAAVAALNGALELDPATTAVLTVDMHRGHLDPEHATQPVSDEASVAVREAAHRLLTHARALDVAVIHVTLGWRPIEAYGFSPRLRAAKFLLSDGVPRTEARKQAVTHGLEGSIQCELMPEIGPEPTDHRITNKKTFSSFLGTDLDLLLRTFLKVDTLLIMGVNTNTCVLNAAFDACNRGYSAIVVGDACASSYGDDLHAFALDAVARTCGWVLTAGECIQKLDAGVTR